MKLDLKAFERGTDAAFAHWYKSSIEIGQGFDIVP